MKLDLLLTADYANVTGDGKLNVIGIFREIYALQFPARHSSMYLIVCLAVEPGEYGTSRNLSVKLLNADEHELIGISGQINVPEGEKGRFSLVNAILEFKDIIFVQPGIYRFVVFIDKDYRGETFLYINQAEAHSERQGQAE